MVRKSPKLEELINNEEVLKIANERAEEIVSKYGLQLVNELEI